ncbi:MAG: FAD-binding oxidoreductase [Deltaproteobacteria bacterium]|nr:FAD-binding oxidoreductase [Deltaproteobacteria bacterium]
MSDVMNPAVDGELAATANESTKTCWRSLMTKRSVFIEIWDNLPIWFFYLEAIGLLHFLVANVPRAEFDRIGIPVCSFALTTVFPLFWVVAYYIERVRNSKRLAPFGPSKYVVPAVIATIPVVVYAWYAALPFFRFELRMSSLVRFFELMQLFWIGAFIVHVGVKKRAAGLVTFFVVCWVYGTILENGGIVMGYFFEPGYRFYLGRLPAPFATMMGWCLAFYACIWIAEFWRERFPALKGSVIGSALLITTLAISLDLQLDPLASLSGVFWRWNEHLPPWFLSVPFVNYVAWFCAFLPFAYAYFLILNRTDLNASMKNWNLLKLVPNVCVIAALMFFGIMAVAEGGFSGPTYVILGEFIEKILPY